MVVAPGASLRRDLALTPKDVIAFDRVRSGVKPAGDDAAARKVIRIRENESAEVRHAIVIVENEGGAGLKRHFTDFVDANFRSLRGRGIKGRRVKDVRDRDDL